MVDAKPTNLTNSVEGRISDFKYFGSTFYLQVATKLLGRMMVKTPAASTTFNPSIDAPVWLGWSADASVVVKAS